MTCPCGHYDYVDSAAETLAQALTCKYHLHHLKPYSYIYIYIIDHRYRANRIIHEKLTGISLFPGIPHEPSEQE